MQFGSRRIFSKTFASAMNLSRPTSIYRSQLRLFASKVIQCPTMGDSITEGTVQEYSAKEGDFVKRDDIVAVVETDKVMVDIRAPEDGVITKFHVPEGEVVEVGADFFEIDPEATGSAAGSASKEEPAPSSTQESTPEPTPAPTPAPETKAAPATPPPSQKPSPPPASSGPPPPGMQIGSSGLSTITGSRTETRVKMSRMRQTIAKRLKEAQNTNAMLTTFNEIDMSAFMKLRSQFQDSFQQKHGVKLGFMGAFVRGVVQAAKEQPVVNAVIEADEIIYRDYI